MSTSIQLLALCLAVVGSLTIAVALAGVILEVILVMMCRGLPTPHLEHGQGNGVPHSADSQFLGPRVRLYDHLVVVRYRLTPPSFDREEIFRSAQARTTDGDRTSFIQGATAGDA